MNIINLLLTTSLIFSNLGLQGQSPSGTVPSGIYIYLNGQRIAMEENGKKSFFHNDHLGGTNVVTDEAGRQVKYLEYRPFGETKVEEGIFNARKKFTGKELDEETGLYNFLARFYDPKMGRFISPDPLQILLLGKNNTLKNNLSFRFKNTTEKDIFVALLYNPQNLNKYSYCLNNPINYTDPLGLWVAMGKRKPLRPIPGQHTVIILHPDKEDNFINDKSIPWYRNKKGELEATLSANPNWKLNLDSLYGNLIAYPSNKSDRPSNLKNIERIIDPLKRSDTQLIRDIINSANKYHNNLPCDPDPSIGDPSVEQSYNSNSYTRGVFKDAGIPNPPLLPGWIPGWDIPIPLNEKRK
jgi:RHS repeat-associated protein